MTPTLQTQDSEKLIGLPKDMWQVSDRIQMSFPSFQISALCALHARPGGYFQLSRKVSAYNVEIPLLAWSWKSRKCQWGRMKYIFMENIPVERWFSQSILGQWFSPLTEALSAWQIHAESLSCCCSYQHFSVLLLVT